MSTVIDLWCGGFSRLDRRDFTQFLLCLLIKTHMDNSRRVAYILTSGIFLELKETK
jgi:hypothetical protein